MDHADEKGGFRGAFIKYDKNGWIELKQMLQMASYVNDVYVYVYNNVICPHMQDPRHGGFGFWPADPPSCESAEAAETGVRNPQ